MKLNEAYPSKYLTAEDLMDRDHTLTIADVSCEDIGQGAQKSRKLVITFAGKKKQFVVNKTNAKTIEKVLGSDETDDWIGKQITIGPREVEFQGDMILSIRVSLRTAGKGNPPLQREPEADQDGGNVQEDF